MKSHIKSIDTFINESKHRETNSSLKKAMETPEFKEILNKGFKIASSPLQLERGTLVLNGIQTNAIILFGNSGYIIKQKFGADRLRVITLFRNKKHDEYWPIAFEFVLNRIDPINCGFTKEGRANAKYSIENIISNRMKTLGVQESDIKILTRYIKHSSLNVNAEMLTKACEEAFTVENNKFIIPRKSTNYISINIKGLLEVAHTIKIPLVVYVDSIWKIMEGVKATNIEFRYDIWQSTPKLDLSYAANSTFTLSLGLKVATAGSIVLYLKDCDGVNITINLLEPKIYPHIELHNTSDLTIKAETNNISIQTINPAKIKTNLSADSLHFGNINKLQTYKEQYKVQLFTLEGTPIDPDHDTDINVYNHLKDIW